METERYEKIRRDLDGIVKRLGYDCAGFETVKENGASVVRLYVEMPGGVDTGDCEIISQNVGSYLDSIEDELPERYFLEISSPGLERPLFTEEDFRRFVGKKAEIRLKNNRAKLRGVLRGVSDDGVIAVETPHGEKSASLRDISRAHLVYEPSVGQKKTFRKIPKKKNSSKKGDKR